MTEPRFAVAYIRVSTEHQELGEEAQRAQIEAWCARQRPRVTVRAFYLERVSGGAPLEQRPQLLEALDALRELPGGSFLVARRDRLARDVVNAALIERVIQRAGARLVSCAGEGTEQDDPSSQLLRSIVDAFAQYERLVIRARTKAALDRKRARGERLGRLPFGFRADGSKMTPDEYEAQLIGRVIELRREGRSIRDIVVVLGDEQWKNREGNDPTKSLVQRILQRVTESTPQNLL